MQPCQTIPYIEPVDKETPKQTIYGESVAAWAPAAEWGVLARTVAEECSCGVGGGGRKEVSERGTAQQEETRHGGERAGGSCVAEPEPKPKPRAFPHPPRERRISCNVTEAARAKTLGWHVP